VVWEVKAARFFPSEDSLPAEECRLIIGRNVLSGEVKYFLSNDSRGARLEVLLHVAFSRWHIERMFQDGKGQVGMDHFEVRRYLSLRRHLILSMISFLFLAKQTHKLRGKKLLVEPAPSASGGRSAA
jgi:SRSO17 transposase